MKRRRLQHSANTLCQMFCGWRLANSFRELGRMGSGLLIINALDGSSRFGGEPIAPLNIAGELHAWLADDLAAQRIPPGAILRAELTANLAIETLGSRPKRNPAQYFGPNGGPLRSGGFFRCAIACESLVATDEAEYRSRRTAVEAWPVGWPDG